MSQLLATPITMIAASARNDTGPMIRWPTDAARGHSRAMVMPRTNGTPITNAISASMSTADRSMSSSSFLPVGCSPPQNAMFSGIRKIASTLLTAVIDTDSATSPPARWVRMLETFPGGQQATRIIPSATDPRTSSSRVSANVSAGSSRNCASTPIAIVPGRRTARAKSSSFVSSAIPNRIVPITILSVVSDASSNAIVMLSTSVTAALRTS